MIEYLCMKTLRNIFWAYVFTGCIYASAFILSGGYKLDFGMGILGQFFTFLIGAIFWPLIIFWKSESGLHYVDFIALGLFASLVLIMTLFSIIHKKRKVLRKDTILDAEKN